MSRRDTDAIAGGCLLLLVLGVVAVFVLYWYVAVPIAAVLVAGLCYQPLARKLQQRMDTAPGAVEHQPAPPSTRSGAAVPTAAPVRDWPRRQYSCLTCGRVYRPRVKHQKYCSQACRPAAHGARPRTRRRSPRRR